MAVFAETEGGATYPLLGSSVGEYVILLDAVVAAGTGLRERKES